MGIVDKFTLDRLKEPRIDLRFKCPCCKTGEIRMSTPEELSPWGGATCRKCRSKVVLDCMSVTVIRDPACEA